MWHLTNARSIINDGLWSKYDVWYDASSQSVEVASSGRRRKWEQSSRLAFPRTLVHWDIEGMHFFWVPKLLFEVSDAGCDVRISLKLSLIHINIGKSCVSSVLGQIVLDHRTKQGHTIFLNATQVTALLHGFSHYVCIAIMKVKALFRWRVGIHLSTISFGNFCMRQNDANHAECMHAFETTC